MSAAGEGNMEISIGSGGRNIPNRVQQAGPGRYQVAYVPREGGMHQATVKFNGELIPGSV